MKVNAIIPEGPSVSNFHFHEDHSRGGTLFKGVYKLWNRVKISRLGQYSDGRKELLGKYCQSTSLLRVLLVCALTPFPALMLAIVLECIPLQSPDDGWKANYGAWIRLWLIVTSAALGSLFQIRSATSELSYRKIFLVGIGTGCGTATAMIGLAAAWAFPTPFGIAITSFPFQILIVTFFLVSIRTPGTPLIPQVSAALKHRLYLIVAQSGMAFVYIIFTIVFAQCTAKQQFGMFLLLPVLKLVFKSMVARLASDNEETIPAVVVFTVDVFNGLYTSKCIQSSRSWWASLVMITLNMGRTIISLWGVGHETRTLEVLNHQKHKIAQTPDMSHGNRSRSPLSFFISKNLQTRIIPSDGNMGIHPVNNSANVSQTHRHQGPDAVEIETKMAQYSHKVLFHLEYLALVEYVESVIPTLYVIYLSILSQLPSAKYYPHMSSLSARQLQMNIESILVYAFAEIMFLAWLHVTLRRKFGFSLLYQLAFVLEIETELLQARLFTWIPAMLELTLVHFGLDFSFRFGWLNPSPKMFLDYYSLSSKFAFEHSSRRELAMRRYNALFAVSVTLVVSSGPISVTTNSIRTNIPETTSTRALAGPDESASSHFLRAKVATEDTKVDIEIEATAWLKDLVNLKTPRRSLDMLMLYRN